MASELFTFGPFVLDVAERRLSNGGQPVHLAPKAHDLLVALVRHAGRLVTKRDLLDLVWPATHVEEGILAVHVASLRKALGDQRNGPSYIETVPRAGYRFTAPVTAPPRPLEPFPMRWPIGVLPTDAAVYEHIGRGRTCLRTTSRTEIPKAIAAFQSAIALDPAYAAAHAGLALACCVQAELRLAPHAQAYSEARASALRALAMDSSCADAQVALGAVLFLSDWHWAGAERALQRALDLNPDHTEGYLLYGRLLDALGDLQNGLAAKQKALEHAPSSALVHLQIALSYWHQRHYDEVIAWADRALALDPTHLLAREFIAGAWLKKGDVDRHMAVTLAHAETFGVPRATLDHMQEIYRRDGRQGLLRYTLEQMAGHGGAPLHRAILAGELGRLDEAFASLDLAIDARDPCVVELAVGPQWDCLRGDSRFEQAVARVGLSNALVRLASQASS